MVSVSIRKKKLHHKDTKAQRLRSVHYSIFPSLCLCVFVVKLFFCLHFITDCHGDWVYYKTPASAARSRAMNPPITSGRVFNAVRFTINRLVT